MTTETQIAEKKIKSYKDVEKTSFRLIRLASCKSHKASCQRFLEFLVETFSEELDLKQEFDTIIHDKQTDLKNAIKKYDEAGI